MNKRATELANTVPDKKVHGLIRHAYIKESSTRSF